MIRITLLLLFFIWATSTHAQDISFQEHQELGNVHWFRTYDDVLAKAKEEKKPVLILFQEVPGCATCRNYGKNVLTHPLLVEGIESSFIPLCIFNNKGGKDKKILENYNEPSWNNPVVRIVDSNGNDLIDRVSGRYDSGSLISAMNTALTESGRLIPKYLSLLEQELNSEKDECFLSMFCFWTGEKEISNINGVIGTQAGFMEGREVVKVTYDKNTTNPKELKQRASKNSCGDQLYTEETNYRVDKESKYYLQHSLLKHVPLTSLQSTKVNRALALKEDPFVFLSPSQKQLFENVKKSNGKGLSNFIETDFLESWSSLH